MPTGWLFLLYALPTRRGSERVSLWRKLKKFGAVPFKTSAYLLPDNPANYERFQWLAKQIKDAGGDATLIRAKEIEGYSQRQVEILFNEARSEDYGELIRELNGVLRRKGKIASDATEATLERLRGRLAEIQAIDFFHCSRAEDALMLFQKAEGLRNGGRRRLPLLDRAGFQGRLWLTRPQPGIDRVSSAWLIKNFIDSKPRFVFAPKPEDHPDAIPFDMAEVELTHQGDDCTFETLLKRFGLKERRLGQIAEMIHDADLGDGKFHAPGADGIDRVLQGLARLGFSDERILAQGFICFDALYAQLKDS